ncbi:Kelch-like protein 40a [Colletotrichum siamense]|uniref:Kelch-like protein 40a n=1 Tax=Colletotrichum siamense TaxID=690259 RepID=UPI00187325AC|nr:Kelch-like protein 40a [Colletotrichum siamense]KAF5501504.1 Kelch-like protein 40a [Colletotrichum siamense]
MSPFGDQDQYLLMSGILSDCMVICGDKSWNLHKTILCTRSSYFKSVLLNNWPEAKISKVEITEYTPNEIDQLIRFIYLGKVNFQPFEKAHTILHNCARLWILGDYFNVQALCDEVMDYLTNKVVPRNGRLAEAQGFSLNPQDWLDAGRCIYTEYEKKHKLKDAFLAITLDKIFVRKQAINMREYKTLCREYNQFGTDAMLKLIKDGTTRLQ